MDTRRTDESGFTLIELMVVVVVIAILLAIAIPTFMGARERAAEAAAKARTDLAAKAQAVVYTDDQRFTQEISVLESVEPSLEYGLLDTESSELGTAEAVVKGKVYVRAVDQVVTLVSKSSSGKCFWMKNDASIGMLRYASGECDVDPETLSWTAKW